MARRPDEQKIIGSNPRHGLLIFPFKKHYTGITPGNVMDVNRIDATSSVVSFVYQRSKTEPSGTFSITMKGDKNWTNLVRQGDWLLIYESAFKTGIRGPGTDNTEGLRCLGNVDRVSRQKTITNEGHKVWTYRIDGRDFGKVFEKNQFYYNPYIPKQVQENFVMLRSGIKITGTPEDFIRSYLDLYLGEGFIMDQGLPAPYQLKKLEELDQMLIPEPILKIFGPSGSTTKPTGKLLDILRIEIGGANGQLTPQGFSWSVPPEKSTNGSLWEILTSVSNPVMNELYLTMKYYPDERKVFPTIVLRQLPFTKNIFPKLPYLIVQENMIINDDMGFHDHERYNWINMDPKNSWIANYPQFMAASQATRQDQVNNKVVPLFPFINIESIKRYGFSPLHLNSEFLMVSDGERKEGSSKTDLQLAEEWMKTLIDWWKDYDRYESGTMLVKGFSEVNTFEIGANGKLILNNKLSVSNPTNKPVTKLPSDQYCVGNNIYVNSRDRLYQLEGYSLEWSAPGECNTTFVLTRGVHWKEADSTVEFVDVADGMDKQGPDGTVDSGAGNQKDLSVSIIKRK